VLWLTAKGRTEQFILRPPGAQVMSHFHGRTPGNSQPVWNRAGSPTSAPIVKVMSVLVVLSYLSEYQYVICRWFTSEHSAICLMWGSLAVFDHNWKLLITGQHTASRWCLFLHLWPLVYMTLNFLPALINRMVKKSGWSEWSLQSYCQYCCTWDNATEKITDGQWTHLKT